MKKFLMILLITPLLFVSCGVDDIEDEISGSACETLDSFKCDGNILLKCEDYAWEKIKKCSDNKRCDATKGTCEETGENSEDNGDTDNNGNTNPGGNQGGDNGNTNPGGDNGDSGYTPDPSDSGDSGYNPPDNGDSGDSGYNPPDNGDSGDSGYNPPDNGDSGQNPPAPNQCTGLSIDWSSFTYYADEKIEGYFADVEFGNTSKSDDFSIEFCYDEYCSDNTARTGNHNLGSGANTNYSTCTECVMVYQDLINNDYSKYFFQQSGTLNITKADNNRGLAGTLSAKLVEVDIDASTLDSTPVSGGECVEIESGSFNYNGNGGNDNNYVADENIKPVPSSQDNTVGASCNSSFVENCNGSKAVYCEDGEVANFSCKSSEKCLVTLDSGKNYADCYKSCSTLGDKKCESGNNGNVAFICMSTSQGKLYLYDESSDNACN